MAVLFRPIGLRELALIWDLEWRGFPPRLSHQPIFYPVANVQYATEIASQWNVKDEASDFCGYVTRFSVADDQLQNYERKVVGASHHVEYWVPAQQLNNFNDHITSSIDVVDAYFGENFIGYVPEKYGLRGKNATQQLVILAKLWDYSRFDFMMEVSTNRKAMYLNAWFWAKHDFSPQGLDGEKKRVVIGALRHAWEVAKITVPLPSPLINQLRES